MFQKISVLGVALLALMAVGASPAAAQYGPDVEASVPAARPADPFTLSGSGFPAEAAVVLTLAPAGTGCATSSDGVELGSTASAADGTFAAEVRVPTSVQPGPYVACARSGDVVAEIAVEVLGAQVTAPTTPGGVGASPSLPRTGSDTAPFTVAGAGLLAAGGILLMAARRRRLGTGAGDISPS